jgi:hypothetical protein
MAFTEDLDIFLDLDGFGVPVTAGAVSGVGILDVNSEIIFDGAIIVKEFLLTVSAAVFGQLNYGDPVVVDGINYKAEMEPQFFDDGALCKIPLIKVTPDQVPVLILDGNFL